MSIYEHSHSFTRRQRSLSNRPPGRGAPARLLPGPAPYGAPAADEALAADVAAGLVAPANRMHDYLAARTSFFDRTVVSAIDRGVRQVVVGAAGYDGRAFRYAKPGVRWFEVDHPATQRDTNRYPLDGITIRRFSTPRTTWAAVGYGVILPRAHALYAHAASELNEPRLLEMLRDGRPVYAWPYDAWHVWTTAKAPLAIRAPRNLTRSIETDPPGAHSARGLTRTQHVVTRHQQCGAIVIHPL